MSNPKPRAALRPGIEPEEDVLTAQEVARWLRLDRHHIYRFVHRGQLKAVPFGEKGHDYRFFKEDVKALADTLADRPRRTGIRAV